MAVAPGSAVGTAVVSGPAVAVGTGVGAGVRYKLPFGPIRADVAMPLNRRPGDAAFQIYVSIGQAF